MTSPQPCGGWTIDTAAIPNWATATAGQQQTAADVATYLVWALSGRRFGVCTVTVRPAADMWWCGPHGVMLAGPVVAVTQVLIDGQIVPPGEYRQEGSILYRTAGQSWPTAQDLSEDPSEAGTWQITYQRGVRVPAAGNWAVTAMARELLEAMIGGPGSCPRIPARAQSVVREGVAIQLVDPATFIDNGRTGVTEVDMFLAAVNPNQLAAPPLVWSPDTDQTGLFSPYLPAGEWWWRM